MARLLFRDSQGREGTVELTPTETVFVGRGLECAIRTDDGMVSRRHSQIRMEGGRYTVEDLGSANGTHLNNVRVQKQAVGHADVIQCGSLIIRFLDEHAAQPQAQPAGGGSPPPKKGGTMVLDRNAPADPPPGGGGFASSAPAQSPFAPGNFGQPTPGFGGGVVPAPNPGSYGAPPMAGPPQMPMGAPMGGPPAMPSGMPPGMNGPPSIPPGAGPAVGGSMFNISRPGFGGSSSAANSAPAPNLPYGGPPGMPGGGPPGMPYGGPPGMPGMSPPPATPGANLPYGGPPGMPTGGATNPNNPNSMFGRDAQPRGATPGRPVEDGENKVLVDLGLQFDPEKADKETKALRAELDKASGNFEREVADGKRVRAEMATLRERVEELRAQVKDREDQVTAHDRVADELRDELQQTRNELSKARNEMGELAENMGARERQAARAVEDTAKIREAMEELNRQLMELSRTKDEGWKKLNDQLTEIEHLREVINEQERMLEERRIGLISQEEVIKELRDAKEKSLKQVAQLRAERDEAVTNASRQAAQVNALEDENKRMGRMVVESQTDQGRGGGGDQMMRIQGELKDARVDFKKIEADRDRLAEQYAAADRDRTRLESKLAQVEVDLQETQHARMQAESARGIATDALAKAEVARHKAAEELLSAAKARDTASTGNDAQIRELEKLRKRVGELEKAESAAAGPDPAEVQREREAAERKYKLVEDKANQAERSLATMQAEVDAAKTDAAKARAEAARARASADSQAEAIVATPTNNNAVVSAAREVYEAINDILSEMRNNMVLVQGELPNMKSDDNETMQAVTDAVESLIDNAETAKGALRSLRDVADGK